MGLVLGVLAAYAYVALAACQCHRTLPDYSTEPLRLTEDTRSSFDLTHLIMIISTRTGRLALVLSAVQYIQKPMYYNEKESRR